MLSVIYLKSRPLRCKFTKKVMAKTRRRKESLSVRNFTSFFLLWLATVTWDVVGYYENHRTVEWVRLFVQRPLPLSFLLTCPHWFVEPDCKRLAHMETWQEFKLKAEKGKNPDNGFKNILIHLSTSFPFPIFSLNFECSQLTTTRRNVGGSTKESESGRCRKFRRTPL